MAPDDFNILDIGQSLGSTAQSPRAIVKIAFAFAQWTAGCLKRYVQTMRPVDIQPIGVEIAVKWDDGGESYLSLQHLRRGCPCAGCKGEMDILGNVYKGPEHPLPPSAFKLLRIDPVGTYALQPVWADGHATGIYSFEYLRRLAEAKPGPKS